MSCFSHWKITRGRNRGREVCFSTTTIDITSCAPILKTFATAYNLTVHNLNAKIQHKKVEKLGQVVACTFGKIYVILFITRMC